MLVELIEKQLPRERASRYLREHGTNAFLYKRGCHESHFPLMATRAMLESIGPYALLAAESSDQRALQLLSECGVILVGEGQLSAPEFTLSQVFREYLWEMMKSAIDSSDDFVLDPGNITPLPFSRVGVSMVCPETLDLNYLNARELASLDVRAIRDGLFRPIFGLEEQVRVSETIDPQLISAELMNMDRLYGYAGVNRGAQQVLNINTIQVVQEHLEMR